MPNNLHDDKYRGGREVMDPRPMALPSGFRRPPSLIDQMRLMIRREMSEAAQANGRETFEEANDFDVDDEADDPTTPWEHAADGHDELQEELREADLAQAARRAGYRPPPKADPVKAWAEANGWQPPTPAPTASPLPGGNSTGPGSGPQAPSAGASNVT